MTALTSNKKEADRQDKSVDMQKKMKYQEDKSVNDRDRTRHTRQGFQSGALSKPDVQKACILTIDYKCC